MQVGKGSGMRGEAASDPSLLCPILQDRHNLDSLRTGICKPHWTEIRAGICNPSGQRSTYPEGELFHGRHLLQTLEVN